MFFLRERMIKNKSYMCVLIPVDLFPVDYRSLMGYQRAPHFLVFKGGLELCPSCLIDY